jgi:lipoate-protein ligase B
MLKNTSAEMPYSYAMRTAQITVQHQVEYAAGLDWLHNAYLSVLEARKDSTSQIEQVGFFEHNPVYTLGARANRNNLIRPENQLAAPLVQSSRGGDITFHGPGQIVCYPVFDLNNRQMRIGDYIRALESVIIDALRTIGLNPKRIANLPGVWIGENKIAALGVRLRNGISQHGFAINVSTDLDWYNSIIPCGIRNYGVTSTETLGLKVEFDELIECLATKLCSYFGVRRSPLETADHS